MDGEVLRLGGAANSHRGAARDGIIEQALDPGKVARIDDLGDALLVDRPIGIEVRGDLGLEQRDQPVLLLRLDEDVVRADAGLAAIELLGRGEIGRDLLQIGAVINNDGRFSAQFQRNAGEVPRGGGGDQLADPGAAGEEDVIERQFEQRGGDADIAFEQGHFGLVEGRADDAAGQSGRRRAQVGELDHAAIAGGDGGGERSEHQTQREVPGPENQADAARLVHDLRSVGGIERGGDFGRRHPGIEIVDIALDIAEHVEHFGHADFLQGLARILPDRGDDLLGMGLID